MTTDDLSTLLRDHVSSDEPALPIPAPALRDGRRRLRRRRLAVGGVSAAVLAIGAAVAAPLVSGSEPAQTTVMDPASQQALDDYDALRMPELMDEHVRRVLERSVPDLGPSTFSARDDQGQDLPERYWDRASGLSVTYGPEEHRYDVSISHARSEAEGDPERYCAEGLAEGWYLDCTVDRTADGDVVISRTDAVRPLGDRRGGGWMAVTAGELETIDVDRLWFLHTVKVIKSETLLTYVTEAVKATGRDPDGAFTTPLADLVEIGTDPELVMPVPPPGDDGCPAWTMESEDFQVSCE